LHSFGGKTTKGGAPMPSQFAVILFLVTTVCVYACTTTSEPNVEPRGAKLSEKTVLLEKGAQWLQKDTPTQHLGVYLIGFHPMKDDPNHQMEAHHFCNQIKEDFMQCALFDGNTADANLNGIEYIISEKLFNELPEDEKKYWHPHNYEILSGQLIAPGIPRNAEKELMKTKMNSYGKTWHVWDTGNAIGHKGTDLPLGEPKLAWSFNRDGEAQPGLVESRDHRLKLSTDDKRRDRKDLVDFANPQEGVDVLAEKFDRYTEPMTGVRDKKGGNLTH